MNSLENLVPPLDLCKQIPAGKFADSALVWIEGIYDPKKVLRRAESYDEPVVAPAPTLEEIMEALPACTCYRLGKTCTVALCNDTLDNGVKSRRAATAALRLWLEVEGVKDE